MVEATSSRDENEGPSKKETRKKKRKELRKVRDAVKQLGTPEEIRRFRIFLEKTDLSIENIQSLTKFLNFLKKETISIDDLQDVFSRLKKHEVTIANLASFIEMAENLRTEYGKPYGELVEEYEQQNERIQNATLTLKEMESDQQDLEAKIFDLEDLIRLQETLRQHSVSLAEVMSYIDQRRQLSQFGFDEDVLRKVAEELRRLEIGPKEAGNTIASWVIQDKNFSNSINRVELELEESKKKLERSKREEEASIIRLKLLDQKTLESQKRIESLENDYSKRRESLENEYKAKQQELATRLEEQEKSVAPKTATIFEDNQSYLGKLLSENRTLRKQAEAIKREIELVMSISILIRDPQALTAPQLDNLVTEFMNANDVSEKAEESPSLERLAEARRVLLSALRKWSLVISR
jgi:chromosome segregation ATPase